MNIKKILLAATATSILASSSVFANDFYVRGGVSGAMSMKPSMIKNGTDVLVPSAYIGAGMNVVDNIFLGVEARGWLNGTQLLDGLELGDYVLKDTPFAAKAVISYHLPVSDMMSFSVSAKGGYAKGSFGIDEIKDEKKRTETKKNAILKSSEFSPMTFGLDLVASFSLADNLSVDLGYFGDYYSIVATEEAKKAAEASDDVRSKVDSLDEYMLDHKLSLGLTFKF